MGINVFVFPISPVKSFDVMNPWSVSTFSKSPSLLRIMMLILIVMMLLMMAKLMAMQ